MKKVLAIIRESTDRQETDSQKKELIEFLGNYGYSVSQVVVIEAAGASARKKNAKYLKLLQDIKDTITGDPDIEAVGLWNLDRLGRVDDSLIEMKNWFIKNKIQLYCKSPSLTLLRPDGTVDQGAEIAYGVFAALVKQQTEDLFNKFKRGKDRNKAQGRYNGGFVRLGYHVVAGKTVINESEASVIREIYNRYVSGDSTYKVASDMSGIGTKIRDRLVSHPVVCRVLRHKGYSGTIVTKETYDKAEALRKNGCHPKTSVHKGYLGISVFKCPECGYHMSPDGPVYRCVSNKRRKIPSFPDCHNGKTARIKHVDAVLSDFRVFWVSKFYQEKREEDYKNKLSELRLRAGELQRLIGLQTEKRNRLKELYINLELSEGMYRKKSGELISETISLQASLEKIHEEIDSLEVDSTVPEIRKIITETSWENLDRGVRLKILGHGMSRPREYIIDANKRLKPWWITEEGA